MPVIRLNRVVLPAPFGPMMALRSPAMTRNDTSRVAFSPPKFFDRFLSSRAGTSLLLSGTRSLAFQKKIAPGPDRAPASLRLFAELTWREVLVVDGLRKEFVLAVRPELADVRVGLDDRIPQLILF